MRSRVPARLRLALVLMAISGLFVTCRLGDLVTSPSLPVLNISIQRLKDSAAVGSTVLRTATVAVTNTGEGQLTWTGRPEVSNPWSRLSDTTGKVIVRKGMGHRHAG